MTTNKHTPIANGASNDASTWNNPLGDLDAAITANENEIVAARGGSATLGARIAAVISAYQSADNTLDGRIDNLIINAGDASPELADARTAIPSSSAAPTLAEMLRWANANVYNVKAFGALGDGITDDSTAIQACINASSAGDIVVFPNGTYLAYNIRLKPSRIYAGERAGGTGGALLKMPSGVNGAGVLVSEGWWNNSMSFDDPILVRDLRIDGNRDNNTTGHGIVLQNYRSEIIGVVITNCARTGILITDTTRDGTPVTTGANAVENRVLRSRIERTNEYGIYVENQNASSKMTDGWILDNIITNSGISAIRIDTSSGWKVAGNHWWLSAQHGLHCLLAHNTAIIDNYSEGCGSTASKGACSDIYVENALNRAAITITGNRIRSAYNQAGNTYTGIRLDCTTQSPNFTVTGNSILGNDATFVGIYIQARSSGNIYATISGNTLDDCSTAVSLASAGSGSVYATVNGNTITTTGTVINLTESSSGTVHATISGNTILAGYSTLISQLGSVYQEFVGNRIVNAAKPYAYFEAKGARAFYSSEIVLADNTDTPIATITSSFANAAGLVAVTLAVTRDASNGYAVQGGRYVFAYRLYSSGTNAVTAVVESPETAVSTNSAGFFTYSALTVTPVLSGTDIVINVKATSSGTGAGNSRCAYSVEVVQSNSGGIMIA